MLEYIASLLFVYDKDVIELPFKSISEIDRFKNICDLKIYVGINI